MASYFDKQPSTSKPVTEVLEIPDGDGHAGFRRMSILTPQVSQILDDLDLEGHSSSEDENSDPSHSSKTKPDEPSSGEEGDEDKEPSREAPSPPLPEGSPKKDSPRIKALKKPKHPRLDRFYSLRSQLFSSHIAENMEKCPKEAEEERRRAEHERKKKLSKSSRPESPKSPSTKDGFTHRVSNKLKRMTSKDVQPMNKIKKDDNKEDSKLSAGDEEPVPTFDYERRKSRGGVPVDDDADDSPTPPGERNRHGPRDEDESRDNQLSSYSIGTSLDQSNRSQGSLAPEDIDELVDWVADKPELPKTMDKLPSQSIESSDESTQPDSELDQQSQEDLEDDDVSELVRWVSKKENPNQQPSKEREPSEDSTASPTTRYDSHTSESPKADTIGGAELHHEPSGETEEDHPSLEGDSPAELIRTVTRNESTQQDEQMREAAILKWKEQKDKLTKPGDTSTLEHHGSLADADVDELVKWVSRK